MWAMRRTLAAALATLALGFPVLSRADSTAPGTDSVAALDGRIARAPGLGDLTTYAYRSNPMIEAARQEWKASVEKYRVDTGLPNPELMLEGMYMRETLGDTAKPDDYLVRITQGIPLPGRLGKAGEVTQAEAKIARLKLDAAVRDVTVQIRESYQELLYLREARRVAAAHKEVLDQLRKVGEEAYGANRAALVDVMKAQAQSGQLQYDAMLLGELEQTERTRMNSLLNRPPDAPIGPPADEPLRPVVYKLEEVYSLAEANVEEVRIARAGIEKAEAMVGLTRYENLPELTLGVSGGRQNGADQVGVQVGLMLPVWFGKNAGRKGAAEADLARMRAMQANQINDTRTAARDTWFRLQNSERLVRLYRDDLLPQAAKAMETAENWYKQGQGSFSDYVETQSAWYNFQLALARAKADYGKFLARLEKLAGRNLTEREASR